MPIYEYRCKKCGETTEFLAGLGKDEEVCCQSCGGLEMERIISAPSYLAHAGARDPGHTCCGREERCDKPPCSGEGTCARD